jgi:hypothetical protein
MKTLKHFLATRMNEETQTWGLAIHSLLIEINTVNVPLMKNIPFLTLT